MPAFGAKSLKYYIALLVLLVFYWIYYVSFVRSDSSYSAMSERTKPYTDKEDPYESGIVIGRRPHRIHLDDSLHLDKVHLSIRTSAKFHRSRMELLILTWLQTATPNNVYIITDLIGGKDHNASRWSEVMSREYSFNIIGTQCPDTKDTLEGLHCKTAAEAETYYAAVEAGKNYEWYCHFDDDIYVNLPVLAKDMFLKHNSSEMLYLGQSYGMYYVAKSDMLRSFRLKGKAGFEYSCGFVHCLSAKLMEEMKPYFRGKNFISVSSAFNAPEDVVIGFIIESILGIKVKNFGQLHSHVEVLPNVDPQSLHEQMTISFGTFSMVKPASPDKYPPAFFRGTPCHNRVSIFNSTFNVSEDPTRLLSYHCLLFPETNWCHLQ